jgi:hypothetical protein
MGAVLLGRALKLTGARARLAASDLTAPELRLNNASCYQLGLEVGAMSVVPA